MIAKISSAKHFCRALGYNYSKVDAGQAHVLDAQGIPIGTDGTYHYGQAIEQLEGMIPTASRTKLPVFHCSINPHPDDRLTDEQLVAIAREYMERMGYGKQPYIVFKHEDIGRPHIHIVASRVDWKGEKISDAFEFRRSKEILQDIELKYGLRSTVRQEQKQQEQQSRIKRVARVMDGIMARYRFQSIGELNAVLAAYGIAVRETRKQVRGKRFNGLVYVFQDAQGKPQGKPIHSSAIGRGYGHTAMQTAFGQTRTAVTRRLPEIQRAIDAALAAKPASLKAYQEALRAQGIELVARINAQGRIYGATYIDHRSGVVANGSRMGKAYAARTLNALYGKQPERATDEPKRHDEMRHAAQHAPQRSGQTALERAIDRATASAPKTHSALDALGISPRDPQEGRETAIARRNRIRKRKRRRF